MKVILKFIIFGCIGLTLLGAIATAISPGKPPSAPAPVPTVSVTAESAIAATPLPEPTLPPEPTGTPEPTRTPRPTLAPASTATPNPPEYDLAIVNAGGYVRPDDITVTRFRYLLETIAAKTGDTHVAIADATAQAQAVLRNKYGKDVKLLDLMEAANNAIPDGKKGTYKYFDIVVGVAFLLTK